MTHAIDLPVRFADVDPAGIVFYPRYFEMLNAALEDWFAAITGVDFATLHLTRRLGVPTVKLEASFAAPSRLGDRLTIDIAVEAVGRSSCAIRYRIACAGETRMEVRATIVCMDLDAAQAVPWPEEIRAGLVGEMAAS